MDQMAARVLEPGVRLRLSGDAYLDDLNLNHGSAAMVHTIQVLFDARAALLKLTDMRPQAFGIRHKARSVGILQCLKRCPLMIPLLPFATVQARLPRDSTRVGAQAMCDHVSVAFHMIMTMDTRAIVHRAIYFWTF